MIKVQFDHQIFSLQNYGGISRYFANLQSYIDQSPEIEQENGVLFSPNYYLNNAGVLPASIGRRLFKVQRGLYRWNKRYCKARLKFANYDVFHPTYYDPYFLATTRKPFVLTVHDMIHELFPENFAVNDVNANHKKQCISKANHIIAISHQTKRDIQKFFDIPDEKISVIHHGVNLAPPEYCSVPALPARYILYVGDRLGYKNFSILLEAFGALSKTHPDLFLVLAGGGKLTNQENASLTSHRIKEKIIQMVVSDAELNTIYKNAQCFVFPSLYEGFGFPILEAFKNECPVILSNCSCFPEIAGEQAALYFDPHAVHSLIDCIEIIVNQPLRRSELIAQGKKKLLEYSLESCGAKTLALYKAVAVS